jgi:hypothetical protein
VKDLARHWLGKSGSEQIGINLMGTNRFIGPSTENLSPAVGRITNSQILNF